jgi:hypothetical protein
MPALLHSWRRMLATGKMLGRPVKEAQPMFTCTLIGKMEERTAEEADLVARYTNAYKPYGCNEQEGG